MVFSIVTYHYSELYHAKCWHRDFAAVMTVTNGMHMFVNDFVMYHHSSEMGDTIGKVMKIFKKVPNVYLM